MPLSSYSRAQELLSAQQEEWDVLIIGGGITGAGIALDAAARGLRVILLEQYDFASGTSSKSTKLIHGGLRYLKQLEFGLVRTVGRERAILHKLAPHLVVPVDMVLPIVEGGTLGKYATSLALWVYDHLAGVQKHERYRMFSAAQAQQLEPLLRTEGLLGAAVYKEYRTDDARLTMSVLQTAHAHGAACFNYAQVTNLLKQNDRVYAAEVHDLHTNAKMTIRAHVVINAAGPWVDAVRTLDATPKGKRLHLTKGVHIVVPFAKFPIKYAMYFDVAADERMVFAIPRDHMVYIGTTDTNYTGSKEHITVEVEDVQYLLSAVAHMFPNIKLHSSDVCSAWAGLRPLIHEEGRSPSELSRKDEIFISDTGLISMAGGKLTGYRKMAQKAVDKAITQLPDHLRHKVAKTNTARIPLHGAPVQTDLHTYIQLRSGEVRHLGIQASAVAALVSRYGTGTEEILDHVFNHIQRIQDPALCLLWAEVLYTLQHEMVTSVSDFLIRRTGAMYFDVEFVRGKYHVIAAQIASELRLDESSANLQLQWFEAVLQELRFR